MPRYTVQILPSAERDIARLPGQARLRAIQKIDALAENPRPPGVTKLKGADDLYRVRVGDYRVIYRIGDRELVVSIVRARRRDEVY